MIRAILRAQWFTWSSYGRGATIRTLLFTLTNVVWYGFWTFFAYATYEFTSDPDSRRHLDLGLAAGLMLVLIYSQFVPLLAASMGTSLDLRKLMLYPVPHRKLFALDVMLRATSCTEMLLLLAGAGLGLSRNPALGSGAAAPRIAASILLFILLNLLLATGLRSLLDRLLSRRRVREVLVFVLVMAFALPRLLIVAGPPLQRLEVVFANFQTPLWPWTAAARAMLGDSAAGSFAILLAWTLLAYAFGRPQFERSLRFDERAAQATPRPDAAPRAASWSARFFRLVSIAAPDPLAAVVEKEIRSLVRTPRFRLVFIMGFTFGLVVWLPVVLGRRTGHPGIMAGNFLVLVGLYALLLLGQVSYWNAFGFDRSAAQLWFTAPAPLWQALAGKNLAAALFILLEMLAVTSACLLLRIRIPPAKIFEMFVVLPIAALYILSVGNLSSVHMPRGMNPERVAQGGSARRLQGLLFLFYPVALLPVLLAYAARYVFESEIAFWSVMAFAGLLGAVFYWIAMESAAHAAMRKREEILAELSKGEGPFTSD